LPGANGTMIWTRLVGQTLAAEVCAASGPTIVHTDAVAAITASAADLHAFHLCTLSSSCAAPRHATPPSGGHLSLADRKRPALAGKHDEFGVAAGFPTEALVGDHQR